MKEEQHGMDCFCNIFNNWHYFSDYFQILSIITFIFLTTCLGLAIISIIIQDHFITFMMLSLLVLSVVLSLVIIGYEYGLNDALIK